MGENGWKLTEELLETNGNMSWWGEQTVLATCYEDDLMACVKNVWADNSASIAVSECSAETRMPSGSSAPVIAVSLIVVLLIAVLVGVAFYFCVYKKGKDVGKKTVSVEEKGMISNDGMANTMHGDETIDVAM